MSECPFSDLTREAKTSRGSCPFHKHTIPSSYKIRDDVDLRVINGTHQVSEGTANLLADIGGGDRIREFCTRFYARAFIDKTLQEFFFADDGATAHGKRLADWIIQKMGGEGLPWTDSGRWGMRQISHRAAWNSEKRHESVRGRHFKLGETRVWMRLHFWAARECGLHQHAAFWSWYIQFIEHFIAVYERKAPRYAQEDAEWSADSANLRRYEGEQQHCMSEIALLV
eukprot:gene32735-39572_t